MPTGAACGLAHAKPWHDPQKNFGDLDFKTLGLKLWVSSDGGGAWTEHDLTYQHNRHPPLGPAGQVLALDARVNASAGMHGAWATRERESTSSLFPSCSQAVVVAVLLSAVYSLCTLLSTVLVCCRSCVLG